MTKFYEGVILSAFCTKAIAEVWLSLTCYTYYCFWSSELSEHKAKQHWSNRWNLSSHIWQSGSLIGAPRICGKVADAVRFWINVYNMKLPVGEHKYRNLATISLKLPAIPTSNATVKEFSAMFEEWKLISDRLSLQIQYLLCVISIRWPVVNR